MLKNALASFLLFASVALADYTFQTFPAANQILLTSQPLTVRWELRPGNSPESPAQGAPDMIRIVLGSKSADGNPTVYWPPLNGEGNTVASNAGSFQWNWNPTMFTETLPPRGKKGEGSQFFFQIADGTGYISSGQPFYIVESGTPSTAAPSSGAAPSGSTGTATSTNANPSGSSNGNSQSKPPTGSAGPVNTPPPAGASTQSDSAILSPQLAVAAAAVIASAAGSVL